MIKFPVPLKAMIFLKRLWEELWKNTHTHNYAYKPLEVHTEKRALLLDAQELFLEVFSLSGWWVVGDPMFPSLPSQDEIKRLRRMRLMQALQSERDDLQLMGSQEWPPPRLGRRKTTKESDFDREVC